MKDKTFFVEDITVIVTRYREPFDIVSACLISLSKQIHCRVRVIFLDQLENTETEKFVQTLDTENVHFEYIKTPAKSLSFARNYGLSKTKSQYASFCDIDAIADDNWCAEILNTFHKYNAAVVGTKIIPLWQKKPKWFHSSRYVQEFYSLIDLSADYCKVTKVVGASFALDRKFLKELRFNEKLGRQKGILLGGEETEICQQIIKKGGTIFYTPFTKVLHQVSSERMQLPWLLKRAYFGGFSRALKGGKSEPFNKTFTLVDRIAIFAIITPYILGYAKGRFMK